MLSPLLLLLLVATTVRSEFVVSNGQCLTLSPTQDALYLTSCTQQLTADQDFDLNHNKLQIKSSCLDDSLKMTSCYSDRSNWAFYSDGKIGSNTRANACLQVVQHGKLELGDCSSAATGIFATTQFPPLTAPASKLPSLDQQLPSPPATTTTLPPTQQQQQQYSAVDHYLCTCIVDAKDDACDQAVRSACLVGHLNSEDCKDSFARGNHERISDQILVLLANGERCRNFDVQELRTAQREDAQKRGQISLEGVPSKTDHYLCVCLDMNEPQKCKAAIQAACLVGHIPAGDCAASLEREEHEGATNHVLKLIDSGATCSQRLVFATTPAPKPRGFVSNLLSTRSTKKKEITSEDKDLCYCLDDFNSEECGKAVARACKLGKIPKSDCEVRTASKSFARGATRHVLRLIDHGADCPAHRSMTFTNHGCHCLQSWSSDTSSSKTREILSFPNNCADPGGQRGFPWCKTYVSEQCAGVHGATDWDRCDAPKYPVFHMQENEEAGREHYLCVCLSDTSTDEVCVAAVRAACEVGHLPSEQCRESFDGSSHGKVSDSILALLDNGKRCDASTMQRFMSSKVQSTAASLQEGKCAEGYFGFPNCRRKVECATKCKGRGSTCDFATGECTCRPNFVGRDCSQCAEGTSGRHCLPDSELARNERDPWWWSLLQLLAFVIILYWILSFCTGFSLSQYIKANKHKWTLSSLKNAVFVALFRRNRGATSAGAAAQYGIVPLDEDVDLHNNNDSDEEEGGDLGTDEDVERGSAPAKDGDSQSKVKKRTTPAPPATVHNGLAV